MNLDPSSHDSHIEDRARSMYELVRELFPIHRSIAGDGLRKTVQRVHELLPLQITEVPSGTQVLDWVVPDEWTIRDAYVATDDGTKLIDYGESNLAVLNHSQPVRGRLTWKQLKPHVHSRPDVPEATPYLTAFFRDKWGFCAPHRLVEQLDTAPEKELDVLIDAEFRRGAMTIGEFYLAGDSPQEVLIFCHTCHPSLANDNLAAIAVATQIGLQLKKIKQPRYSYRIVFAPATIGAIAWLALHQQAMPPLVAGLVLSTMGDPSAIKYKRTRAGDLEIDRVVQHLLSHKSSESGQETVFDFSPMGYDETHFSSPGFQLPVGRLMRGVNSKFPEYHTSFDNLSFVTAEAMADSLEFCLQCIETLEHNRCYQNLSPYGEPRLGPRGMYRGYGESVDLAPLHEAVLWVLNQSDGTNDLLAIAERSGIPFARVQEAAQQLIKVGLLAERTV